MLANSWVSTTKSALGGHQVAQERRNRKGMKVSNSHFSLEFTKQIHATVVPSRTITHSGDEEIQTQRNTSIFPRPHTTSDIHSYVCIHFITFKSTDTENHKPRTLTAYRTQRIIECNLELLIVVVGSSHYQRWTGSCPSLPLRLPPQFLAKLTAKVQRPPGSSLHSQYSNCGSSVSLIG